MGRGKRIIKIKISKWLMANHSSIKKNEYEISKL